jgi:hypothetical protein
MSDRAPRETENSDELFTLYPINLVTLFFQKKDILLFNSSVILQFLFGIFNSLKLKSLN